MGAYHVTHNIPTSLHIRTHTSISACTHMHRSFSTLCMRAHTHKCRGHIRAALHHCYYSVRFAYSSHALHLPLNRHSVQAPYLYLTLSVRSPKAYYIALTLSVRAPDARTLRPRVLNASPIHLQLTGPSAKASYIHLQCLCWIMQQLLRTPKARPNSSTQLVSFIHASIHTHTHTHIHLNV